MPKVKDGLQSIFRRCVQCGRRVELPIIRDDNYGWHVGSYFMCSYACMRAYDAGHPYERKPPHNKLDDSVWHERWKRLALYTYLRQHGNGYKEALRRTGFRSLSQIDSIKSNSQRHDDYYEVYTTELMRLDQEGEYSNGRNR